MNRRMAFLTARLLVLVMLLVPLTGCQSLLNMLKDPFVKPTMHYKNFRFKDISFKGVTTEFDFEVKNRNAVGLNIAYFKYRLFVDGNQFVSGNNNRGIALKAKSISPLSLPFGVEFQKLAKVLLTFLKEKKEINVRLKVEFGIKTPIGVLPFKFDKSGLVPIPQLPEIKLEGIKLASIGLMTTSLVVTIMIRNQSKIPVNFKAFDYRIGSVDVAGGKSKGSSLAAGKFQKVTIPLQLQNLKVGMALINIIRSKKLPYNIRGNLNMGLFRLPFNLKGTRQL